MPKLKPHSDLKSLEAAARAGAGTHYGFRLFVAGKSPLSTRAIVNVRRFCEENLAGRFRLEISDLVADPALARKEQIVATPTLIRYSPLPQRRFVGTMVEMERVLIAPHGGAVAGKPEAAKR